VTREVEKDNALGRKELKKEERQGRGSLRRRLKEQQERADKAEEEAERFRVHLEAERFLTNQFHARLEGIVV
jgi:hypothetical protein